jgi:hypothetical protein
MNAQQETTKHHWNYKGDDVGYSALHAWVYKHNGKASKCSKENDGCNGKSKSYTWANVSHQYKRDLDDFIELCRSCHAKYDCTDKKRERMRKLNLGKKPPNIRAVKQYDLDGNLIKEYEAISYAAKESGVIKTAIHNVLSGRAKTAGGFVWL